MCFSNHYIRVSLLLEQIGEYGHVLLSLKAILDTAMDWSVDTDQEAAPGGHADGR
jgi:hypothetical protein